jgi:outer membrane protein OmpA-like peptidoglycan-associated protein
MSKQQLKTTGLGMSLELELSKRAIGVVVVSLLALTGIVGVSQEAKADTSHCTPGNITLPLDGGDLVIETKAQLMHFSISQDLYRSSDVVLRPSIGNSIDVSDCNWIPVGTSAAHFVGTFDGGGNTVIFRSDPNDDSVRGGFFGHLTGAVVSNLQLSGTVIRDDISRNGGLAGWAVGTSIANSSFQGSVTHTAGDENPRVGGLVGLAESSTVTSSRVFSTVVSGRDKVGGLIGEAVSTHIERSSSTATVTGTENVGGLVGYLNGPLSASFSSGTVNGERSVGGLVGFVLQDFGTISNSYSTATATTPTSSGFYTVGGLVGFLSDPAPVTNSWSKGAVVGDDPGGLIAFADNTTPVSRSFWDTQTSGQIGSPGGGTAKTTAEMTSVSTFSGATWKIVSGWQTYDASTRVWGICSGVNSGYPFLLWEYTTDPCTVAPPPSNSDSGSSSGLAYVAPVVVPEVVTPLTIRQTTIRQATEDKPARLLGRSLDKDVLFIADSAKLSPQAKKSLRQAARLAKASEGKVAVTGFAAMTNRGRAYEKSVALKRARVVARFLRAQGFDDWIYFHGLSGRQGQAFEGDPRRVEIRILN